MMQEKESGRILQCIGGIYTVATDSGTVSCKARGVFRKRGMTPYAGDFVTVEQGVMTEILPRKNSIIRPPLANLDQLLFVTSTYKPVPNLLLLDQFMAVAIYKQIQPVLVLTKLDLQDGAALQKLYTNAGIPVYPVCYDQPDTLEAVRACLRGKVSALTGNSGAGKSTLLKSLNRMNDLVEGCRITGEFLLDGEDIYGKMDVNLLRKRVGMVFQKPNPFPMSVYDNIAFGPRTHGIHSKVKLDDIVEKSLRDAAIWDELKDRLKKSALGLSGGQQQRLCIARALAVEPEVLLMDEPTSALDPISTSKIEDLAIELKKEYTIVMVTHNMQQAARISDKTAFFLLGEVVEYADTDKLFSTPQDQRTEDYITGRFG